MVKRPPRTHIHFVLALCLLSLTACLQEQKPFVPASPFAESFKPLEIISSVAEREGLSSSVSMTGGMCGSGSGGAAGGPTTTNVKCAKTVAFRSREDADRLTRAVFDEIRQEAEKHRYQEGSHSSGPATGGELHIGNCSPDPKGDGNGFRGCMFLHAFAVEASENPAQPRIHYYFTLDEVRTVQPRQRPQNNAMTELDGFVFPSLAPGVVWLDRALLQGNLRS